MRVHIFDIDTKEIYRKELFILTRPWFDQERGWDVSKLFPLCDAECAFIPFPINKYFMQNRVSRLIEINKQCTDQNILAFGYISGDWGEVYEEYSNIIYFRMGGFASRLSSRNFGFPVALSDQFKKLYHLDHPVPRQKSPKPIIGFCGHATSSFFKKQLEYLKIILENSRRFFSNPLRNDYEPLFASAFERAAILKKLETNLNIECNFIYRNNYRAGAQTEQDRYTTTLEYYNNLYHSDYIVCVRGSGNFSVRLYESLMMGKIPVFLNTDCLLPFPDRIKWRKHLVWVEWSDRDKIDDIVLNFHNSLTDEEFIDLQIQNRLLWKETLSINGLLNLVHQSFIALNNK